MDYSFCGCCCNEKANGGNVAIIRAFTALSASLPARNDAGTPMQPAILSRWGREGIVHGRPCLSYPPWGGGRLGNARSHSIVEGGLEEMS